jgi:hypothetical protein
MSGGNGYSRGDGLRADQLRCPECGGIVEAESVDVGVGLVINDEGGFICPCGWNSNADGRMNVASYDDYFIDAADPV